MTQQHQPTVLQPGSMLPSGAGWPIGLPVMQPQDPEAAARARWAEAQGENEASPDAAEAVEGSNQPEDHHAQHGGGKSSTDGHSKVKRPPGTQQCPRCNSKNTKFCYYNNYNVKQPRYYCRDCQRYWTAGGTLRQLAPGAGRRKAKPTAAGKPEQVEPPPKDAHQKQHNNWEQQPQSGEATPQLARAGSAAVQRSPQDNIGALDTAAAAAAVAAADVLFSSGGSDLLSPASGMQLNPMQLLDGFLPNPLPGKGMQGQQALAGMQAQQQQQQQAGMLAASGGFGTSQQPTSQNPMSRMLSMGLTGFELAPQQHQQGHFQPPSHQQPFGGDPLGQFQQLLDPAAAAAAGIPPHVAAATLAAAAAAGLGGPFGSAALMQAQQQWQNAATAAAAAALDPYRNLSALAAMATAATGQPGPMGHYFMAAAAAAAAASGMMPGGIDMAAAAMAAALGLSGVYPQQAQVQQQQLMAAAAAAAGGFMPGFDGMGALFGQQPTNTQTQQTQPGQQFMQQQMQHLQQAQQMQQMAAYQQQMPQAMMAGAPAALSPGLPQQPASLPTPAMAAVNSAGAQLAPADMMPPRAPQAAATAAAGAEPAGGTAQQQQQRAKVEHEDAKKLMPPPPPLHPQQQQHGQVRAANEVVPDGTADDGRRVRQRTASADGQAAAAAAATAADAVEAAGTAGAHAVPAELLAAGAGTAQQQQQQHVDVLAAVSQPECHAAADKAAGADTPAGLAAPAVKCPLPAAAEAGAAAAPAVAAAGPQDMAVDAPAPAAAAGDDGPVAASAPPGPADAPTALVPEQVATDAQQQQQPQAVPQADVWGAAAQAGLPPLPPLPPPAPSLPMMQQPNMQQQAAFWQNQMQQQYQQHLQQQQLLHFQQQLQFQSQLQQQQNQNHLQGLLQHMQGQLQQQKQVPPELMIMAQHMQQQLAGMGMLQNALTAGNRPGVGGGSSAAGLPPGLNDACNAAALGLLPPDWVQQQMMPGGFSMPPAGVGGLMPPSGIPMYGGAGPDAQGQAVKQQQQQLQQAAAQLAAASAALTGGGPVAAAQIAAALQIQQQQGQKLGPPGNTPQSVQNPAPGTAHNANTNPPQNGMAPSRWPEGSDAAAAAAAAGFWPGLGGLPPAPSGFDRGAASGRLPGLTGLGMSGMTPMAGLSAGQGQSGGMGLGMGAQLGQEPAMQAATAPSVGGGDAGDNEGEGAR